MKRFAKLISCLFTAMILLFTAVGCGYKGYRGKYKGAYTLIYSQVPDMYGTTRDDVWLTDPQVMHLESDSVGRAMYLYFESKDGFLSACIVQKETKETVYFYPEQSTISFRAPDRVYEISNKKLSDDTVAQLFYELCSDERLEAFKADNDWNAPMCEEKLDSAPIILPTIAVRWGSRKDSVNLLNTQWEEQIFAYAEKNGHDLPDGPYDKYFSHANWMATDDYGRRLYYVEAYYYVREDELIEDPNFVYKCCFLEMVAIIRPDRTFDTNTFMIELADKVDYQEQIKELKQANGWDTPLN